MLQNEKNAYSNGTKMYYTHTKGVILDSSLKSYYMLHYVNW